MTAAAEADRVHQQRWLTLCVLCLSLLIIVMDNTILNVAIPSLVRDLGATNTQLQWILDGYTLVFAGLLLTAGSLGDRFGRKRALRAGIVLFGLGSVMSALAGSPTTLILTRGFMGIGGALIMPSTLSILTNVFRDPGERARAIAVWAGFSGLAVALGPLTGGFLLEHFSWSSVFWVNVPICAAALLLGHFFIPESRDPTASPIDVPGAAFSIIGLGSLLYGIIEGPDAGWSSPHVVIAFVVAVVVLSAFLIWEASTETPMLDLSFFKNPRFTAANSSITLVFFAMFGALFLLSQYWQLVHGFSPFQAGALLVPYAAGMMVGAPLAARFAERFGTKLVVTFGLLVMAVVLFTMSFISADTKTAPVVAIMAVMAVGQAFVMAPATESVMGSLPRGKAGVGSAVNDTTRQVGGALGVAVIGSIGTSVYQAHIGDAATAAGITGHALTTAKGSLGGALEVARTAGGSSFVAAAKEAFVAAFSSGLRIGAFVILGAAAVSYFFLPARAAAAAPELLPAADVPEDGTYVPAVAD
jgi:EmrB/QacA subfamily drug resistance transporter